jgi:hypothetical protein
VKENELNRGLHGLRGFLKELKIAGKINPDETVLRDSMKQHKKHFTGQAATIYFLQD